MDSTEKMNDLVDMIAQAVIDKIDERQKVDALAERVFQRVLELKKQEAIVTSNLEKQADSI